MVEGAPKQHKRAQCGYQTVLPTYPAWTMGSRRNMKGVCTQVAVRPDCSLELGSAQQLRLPLGAHGSTKTCICAGESTPGCSTNYNGFTGLSSGPRWGSGLPTKPLWEKQGPEALLAQPERWPSVGVKPGKLPMGSKPVSNMRAQELFPGPGQYHCSRDFDPVFAKKQHATMGWPHSQRRSNAAPAAYAQPTPTLKRVTVQPRLWKPPTKPAKVLEPTPGPGQYHTCDSSFCACTNCEGISQGKTFGLRPPVSTGNVPKPVYPGPADYHVECTTLGAAVAACKDA